MVARLRRNRESRAPGAVGLLLATLTGLLFFLVSSGIPAAGEESSPGDLEAMRAVALGLLGAEDYEGSIEMYREISRLAPEDPRSHYDLAGTLSFLRLYEEAVEPIETAMRLDPGNMQTREMASLIFLNLGRYEEAFAAMLENAELGDSTAMYSLVNMYEKGLGVTADQDRAVFWAERAAEHGHLGAMAIMEEAYRTGRFSRRIDPSRADQWAERLRKAE